MDIAIFVGDNGKSDYTVEVNRIDISLHQLRKLMKECDVDFKFNFVNLDKRYAIS